MESGRSFKEKLFVNVVSALVTVIGLAWLSGWGMSFGVGITLFIFLMGVYFIFDSAVGKIKSTRG
jgi:ABC-type transport system involved in cytochrome bd biosynthesis fused ATPase/permease subunit